MYYMVETGSIYQMSLKKEDFECDLFLEKVNLRVWLDSWVSYFPWMKWILFPCFYIVWSKDLRPVKYWTQMHMYVYVMRCECMSLWCLMQGSNCWILLVFREWLNRVIFRLSNHCISFRIVRCHILDGNFNFLHVFRTPLLR